MTEPDAFWWSTGIEDTFITAPHPSTGRTLDEYELTGHYDRWQADLGLVAELGVSCARYGVPWHRIQPAPNAWDWSFADETLGRLLDLGVAPQVDLVHYGLPAWIEGTCAFTPVNEPSFMAYAAGEKGLFAPHETGRGWDLKVALTRAAIAGIDALWDACPGARMVNVDPLCRVACPPGRPEIEEEARDFNERLVFQGWDMLCGRLLPELGGSREHLDVVGINYYWTNQWEWRGFAAGADGVVPPLAEDDPRRWSLGDLVRLVWGRYGGEVMVSETSHVGEHRGRWLREIAEESETLLLEGVPIRGLCIYPILGMTEWHDPEIWTPMGLWDPVCHRDPGGERLVCEPMLEALRSVRHVDDLHHALLADPRRARWKIAGRRAAAR